MMKLLISLSCFTLTASYCLAEGSDAKLPDEPFFWEYLCTIGGAAALTLLVCQMIKAPLDKVWKLPTRLLAYVIALLTLLTATALTSGLTADRALLAAVNALIAATSAYGMYELTFANKKST